jgi:hypothetical protein
MKTSAEVQQELFEIFNRDGAKLSFRTDDGPYNFVGPIDSWRVVKVAVHEGGDGLDFWLLFRQPGWSQTKEVRLTHLCKVLSWEKTNDGLLLFTDNPGEEYQIEFLDTEDERQLWEQIKRNHDAEWHETDRKQIDHIRETVIPDWWSGR